MRRSYAIHVLLGLVGVCSLAALAHAADSPPAPRPIINVTNVATDSSKYGWLTDDGRKGLDSAVAKFKAGSLAAYVFAAAPGGDFWSYQSQSKATDFISIEDLARQSLQVCEYYASSPCYVVSVNGFDARDANGGLQIQPSMLADQPTEFDPSRVPFTVASDFTKLNGYLPVTKAKAFVVDTDGAWWWEQADDSGAAATMAYADCKKDNKDNVCILYAVNNRVVLTPGGPY